MAATERTAPEDKQKMTVVLPGELAERARDAVIFLRQSGRPGATLTGLVRESLEQHLAALAAKHEIRSFPKRSDELGPGRPVS